MRVRKHGYPYNFFPCRCRACRESRQEIVRERHDTCSTQLQQTNAMSVQCDNLEVQSANVMMNAVTKAAAPCKVPEKKIHIRAKADSGCGEHVLPPDLLIATFLTNIQTPASLGPARRPRQPARGGRPLPPASRARRQKRRPSPRPANFQAPVGPANFQTRPTSRRQTTPGDPSGGVG